MSPQEIKIAAPDLTMSEPPVYANVAHVSYTPYDFRITFSLLMTPHDQPAADPLDAGLTPRGVVEVVLPAASVDSLAELLRAGLGEFVDRFGAPRPQLRRSA
jgi:hypothetical protein